MKYLFLMYILLMPLFAYSNVQVEDYLGRKVILPHPAQRIVALAPHIVENLYSAGAGAKIVGAVDYSDYPEEANDIPRVGAISGFSLEAIIELKPDLVVVWYSGRGGQILQKLDKLGFVSYANNPRVLEDIPRSIRDFGILAGTPSQAEKNAKSFEQQHNNLLTRYANRTPVSTLYQVWNDPLQTLNGKHIISDVIRLCGGENAFADAIPLVPTLSIESVITNNPLAIVASGMGEERPEWLEEWKRWPSLQAVKNNNLFFIPPDIIQRHTARILKGAQLMCNHLDNARNKK